MLEDSSPGDSVKCPMCDQPTKIPRGSSSSTLPFHFILTNILDLASLDISTLMCTSCKSKEKAISRCNDCANFLCASCDNAHRSMRCFEEHQVIVLEANTESVTIHKPLYCNVHSTENLKYFCYSCETPVCNECLIVDHKGTEHRYEIISEAEKHMRTEVEKLLQDTRSKVDYCDAENTKLETALQELQQQHDVAQESIKDAFETILNAVEKRKDQATADLKALHKEREMKIMEQFHHVEKSVEQMEYCAGFTRKLLDNGNGPEILSLKKMISNQLKKLIGSIPKVDVNYSLEFTSNAKKIEEIIPDVFGKFRTESTVSPKETTPPPSLPGMPTLHNGTKHTTLNGTSSTITSSVTASSPISLPTSMQSSFDGDISGFAKNFSIMPSTIMQPDSPPPPINSNQHNVPPVTSMVEYNIHRLASMVENSGSDMSDSIMPQNNNSNSNFLLDDMLHGEQMLNNLQALAKIGDMTNGASLNSLSMMDTFSSSMSHASTTSPILQTPSTLGGINDDIKLSCFSHFRNPDAGSLNGSGRAKATPMQIRVKFGALGPARGQFNSPHGFCLGLDEEIIVADTNNHRIEVSSKSYLKDHLDLNAYAGFRKEWYIQVPFRCSWKGGRTALVSTQSRRYAHKQQICCLRPRK